MAEADRRPPNLPASVAEVFDNGSRGWRRFLRDFSPFILGCVRRLTSDYDERMEIYAHVCERLWVDDCRRIKQYRGHGDAGSCKFTTWLAAVTLNLGREWVRRTRGRKRLFRPIQDLGRSDQVVFKLHYWDGYSAAQIAHILDASEERAQGLSDVEASLARIRRRLTSDHQWRLIRSGCRHLEPLSIDSSGPDGGGATLQGIQPAPDELASCRTARAALGAAIDALPAVERDALILRYRRGLSARAIAVELGIVNYKRVYELQARAITRLREALDQAGVVLSDFDATPLEIRR